MSNPRRTNSNRRNKLRARVLAAYDTCALCGQPVDKTLPTCHDGAPEVDEIIPVSRGGSPYRWDNVQLTHRVCNRRKGNQLPDQTPKPAKQPTEQPQKRQTGYNW